LIDWIACAVLKIHLSKLDVFLASDIRHLLAFLKHVNAAASELEMFADQVLLTFLTHT
jgi:hypothetical protein